MSDQQWGRQIGPLSKKVRVTPAAADLPGGVCRCLIVSKDCVLNVVEGDGTARTNGQFFKGYNPVILRQVLTGADAATTTIEAGY